jgi:hypothetical protein
MVPPSNWNELLTGEMPEVEPCGPLLFKAPFCKTGSGPEWLLPKSVKARGNRSLAKSNPFSSLVLMFSTGSLTFGFQFESFTVMAVRLPLMVVTLLLSWAWVVSSVSSKGIAARN